MLQKWEGGGGIEVTSDSKWGAENNFFSVTLYNFQKSVGVGGGGGFGGPCICRE